MMMAPIHSIFVMPMFLSFLVLLFAYVVASTQESIYFWANNFVEVIRTAVREQKVHRLKSNMYVG